MRHEAIRPKRVVHRVSGRKNEVPTDEIRQHRLPTGRESYIAHTEAVRSSRVAGRSPHRLLPEGNRLPHCGTARSGERIGL